MGTTHRALADRILRRTEGCDGLVRTALPGLWFFRATAPFGPKRVEARMVGVHVDAVVLGDEAAARRLDEADALRRALAGADGVRRLVSCHRAGLGVAARREAWGLRSRVRSG